MASTLANYGISMTHVQDLHIVAGLSKPEINHDGLLTQLVENIAHLAAKSLGMEQYLNRMCLTDVVSLLGSLDETIKVSVLDMVATLSLTHSQRQVLAQYEILS